MILSYLFFVEQWIVLFHLGDGLATTLNRFTWLVPPKDRIWADPFVIYRNETYHIFVEDMPFKTKRGCISVIDVDAEGTCSEPVVALETPYHLSYPCVFQWQNQDFMIPETSQNRTVELYRCVDFPHQWELDMVLMADVLAYDATPLQYNGKWWLFVNLAEKEGASDRDELFVFYADYLRTTEWTPHPLNPIVSDVKCARPAGQLFTQDGKLYRPSQNSLHYYGYGLKLNEIVVLSETEYVERAVSAVEPVWDTRVYGIHTLSQAEQMTCIDGIIYRNRFGPDRFRSVNK